MPQTVYTVEEVNALVSNLAAEVTKLAGQVVELSRGIDALLDVIGEEPVPEPEPAPEPEPQPEPEPEPTPVPDGGTPIRSLSQLTRVGDVDTVADNGAGARNGLLYEFTCEDRRKPGRQSGNPYHIVRGAGFRGDHCLHFPRYPSMNDDSDGKTAAKCRAEYVLFGGSAEGSRMEWGKDYWIGFACAAGPDWEFPADSFEIVSQIHDASPGGSPPWSLLTAVPKRQQTADNKAHWIMAGPGDNVIAPVVPGQWEPFVLHYVPAFDNTGLVQFWHDGKLVVDRKNIITASKGDNGLGPYWKGGIYHYWDESNPRNRDIFIDELRVWAGPGGSFEIVDPAQSRS